MRRSILVIMAAGILSVTTIAFAGGHGGPGKHRHVDGGQRGMHGLELVRKLDLSAEQKSAVDEIYSKAKAQRKAVFSQRRDVRQAMMSLNPGDADYQENVAELAEQQAAMVESKMLAHGALQAQLYDILTPEQRKELEALKQEKRERMSQRGARFNRDSE